MSALRRVHDGQHQPINGKEHADGFEQISRQIAGLEKLRKGQDKNREMEKKRRIREISDHLASHPRAVVIIYSQESKSRIESPALFAGAQQGNVEFRKPGA